MPQKIIIDTDPGIDDAMAIIYALQSPEPDLIGLTTVFGNVRVNLSTDNALRLLEIAGRSDIPVAKGAAAPLANDIVRTAEFVHGDDGLGNIHLPAPTTQPASLSAAAFIVQQIMANPGEITLVPIAPLTNIALALRLEPRIVDHVKNVVLMGGNALCSGNATPAAEANIFCDPEAADIVFGAKWPMTMVGLDVTEKGFMPAVMLDAIAATPTSTAQLLGRMNPFYLDFQKKWNGKDGIIIHDTMAVAYVIDPTFFKTAEWPIRVETQGISRGKTWPCTHIESLAREDFEPWRNRPFVNVCLDVAVDRLFEHVMQRLTAR